MDSNDISIYKYILYGGLRVCVKREREKVCVLRIAGVCLYRQLVVLAFASCSTRRKTWHPINTITHSLKPVCKRTQGKKRFIYIYI